MKYNWKQLEKEYIKSNYLSIKSFLNSKNINYNGNARRKTKGWSNKKRQKRDKSTTKTIEKIIEKQINKEVKEIMKSKAKYDNKNIKIDNLINENGLIGIHKLKIMTEKLKKQKENILK